MRFLLVGGVVSNVIVGKLWGWCMFKGTMEPSVRKQCGFQCGVGVS